MNKPFSKVISIVIALAAVLLIIIPLIFLLLLPSITQDKIVEEVQLKDGSNAYEQWLNVPSMEMKYYFFHINNSNEVVSGSKPIVIQKGPYTFKEKIEKHIIEKNETSITYYEYRSYEFQKDLSVGYLNDSISFFNIPAVSMPSLVERLLVNSSISKELAYSVIESIFTDCDEKLIIQREINELLFKGYKVQFLEKLDQVLRGLNISYSGLPDNTFGFYYRKNCTYENRELCIDKRLYTIDRGVNKIDNLMKINVYNNASLLNFWSGKQCNMINGTDGTRTSPFVNKNTIFYAFSPDICRSMALNYESNEKIENINTMKFTPAKSFYIAPKNSQENVCFCTNSKSNICALDGVLDMSSCRNGAPVLSSLPHFLHANESLLNDVVGLKPDPNLHDVFLHVEPMTGFVLNASRKLQINIQITQTPSLNILSKVRPVLMPLIWVEESGQIDSKDAGMLHSKLGQKEKLTYIFAALITLGSMMTSIFAAILIYKLLKR